MNNIEQTHSRAIGGFLDLELPLTVNNKFSPMLSCGRSGLAWILNSIRCEKIYIPYYTCPVVPELLNKNGINISYYHINEDMMPEKLPRLNNNEYFIYVNYFGVKDAACKKLSKIFGKQLILDLTQAFFFSSKKQEKSFSSVRKFFGVPDGCIVTGVDTEKIIFLARYNGADNSKHLLLRQDGKLSEGYNEFVKHGSSFQNMLQISELSQNILQHIDLHSVAKRRFENFSILHDALSSVNQLSGLHATAALCYPCLLKNGSEIKRKLCEKKIFIPTYWPHLGEELSDIEKNFVDNLVCLPIDQRYNEEDMKYILNNLMELI